ncbi:universal stress protein [Luedemannella helvata]|uniref:Universal stress protein n=1 Tax=Luedemannella helvata TaxID=349315 RepID=A0ABP4W5G8_9ACTN
MGTTYRIVAGVDGSEGGRRALRWAVEHAARLGGTVQAITAWNWGANEAALLSGPTMETVRADAETALADAVRSIKDCPSVPLALEAIEGRPAKVLARIAADADMLVVGSHGHNRLFRAVLGSVSEECVRMATCPVVVVPVPHAPGPDRLGQIMVTDSARTTST